MAQIYDVMLHEMGHALGLMGHSDDPGDVERFFQGVLAVPDEAGP